MANAYWMLDDGEEGEGEDKLKTWEKNNNYSEDRDRLFVN